MTERQRKSITRKTAPGKLQANVLSETLGPGDGGVLRWTVQSLQERKFMRSLCVALSIVLAGTALAAAPKFRSVWKSPEISSLNFKGKTVAALAITDDQSLQMSAEEALVRELMALGVNGIATYRIIPREELKDPQKARACYEKRGVQGVVAVRLLGVETERSTPVVFASGYNTSFWGYYGYGWSSVYAVPVGVRETTTIAVETVVYDAAKDQLAWRATSETKDPKDLQKFMTELVAGTVKEMKKLKLVR